MVSRSSPSRRPGLINRPIKFRRIPRPRPKLPSSVVSGCTTLLIQRPCGCGSMADRQDEGDLQAGLPQTGLSEGVPHYHGHRERLRGRFRDAGADAVSDYELLELVL